MMRRALEAVRDDPNVNLFFNEWRIAGAAAAPLAARQTRYQQIVNGPAVGAARGTTRIFLISAGNDTADVATMDAGGSGGNRNNSRSTYVGANAWRQRLMVVGACERVDNRATATADRHRASSNVGEEISVVATGTNVAAIDRAAAAALFAGTSAAIPQVAGLVAELMRADRTLQGGAGLVRALEFVEATATALHAGAAARSNQTGFGRINAFAAALSVINGGIPVEGHNRDATGFDTFFTTLAITVPVDVLWFGFELRALTQNAVVWLFNRQANRWQRLQDGGAAAAAVPPFQPPPPPPPAPPVPPPPIPGVVHAYFLTLPYRNAAGTKLPSKLVDPGVAALAVPTSPDVWLARFALRRTFLEQHTMIGAFAPGDDPNAAGTVPLVQVPIDIPQLRLGSGSANPIIQRYVQDFDDWIFAISQLPELEVIRVTAPPFMLEGAGSPVTVLVRNSTNAAIVALTATPRFLDATGALLAGFASVADPANPVLVAGNGGTATLRFTVTPGPLAPVNVPITVHSAASGTQGAAAIADADSLAMFPATTQVLGIRVRVGQATTVPGATVNVVGQVLDPAGQPLASGVTSAVATADPAIATAAIPAPNDTGTVDIAVTGVSVGVTTLTLTATVGGRTYTGSAPVTVGDFSVTLPDVRVPVGGTERVVGIAADASGNPLPQAAGAIGTADAAIATAAIAPPTGTGTFQVDVTGVAVGTTTMTLDVTAGTETRSATANVTIFDFSVSLPDAEVAPGERTIVTALVVDDAGSPLPSGVQGAVVSADPTVARVRIPSQSGDGTIGVEVEGVAVGTTTMTFTATVGGRSKQATADIRVSDFMVSVPDVDVVPGSTTNVFARVTDASGRLLSSGVSATAATADATKATATIVSPGDSGLQQVRVTGVASGQTTLTVSATVRGRTKQATSTITVGDFQVSVSDVTVARGSSKLHFARVTDASGALLRSGVSTVVRTGSAAIATSVVGSGDSGLVALTTTGVSIDTTTITVDVTVGGVTKSANGTVQVTDHSVSVADVSVQAGQSASVFARVVDGAGEILRDGVSATVSTSDGQIAGAGVSALGSGLLRIDVTGTAPGPATLTVTATVGGVARTATSTITVTN